MDTSEYLTLQQCFPILKTCITRAPNDVATMLIPSGILTQNDLSFLGNQSIEDTRKAERLVYVLLLQVQLDVRVYSSLISALEAVGPWTKTVCDVLKQTYSFYCHQASSSSVTTVETASSNPISSVATQSQAIQPVPAPTDPRPADIYQYAVNLTILETDFSSEERKLERKTENMVHKFAVLITKVISALVRNHKTVRSICTYLHQIKAVKAVTTTVREPILYFTDEFLDEVEATCFDIDGLFRKLDGYYSWFNYRLVKQIFDAFLSEDINIQTRLFEYETQMRSYCDNRICHLREKNIFGTHSDDADPHVFKINEARWNEMRITQLQEVKEIVGEIMGLNYISILIRSVRNGCVELTLDFQTHVAKAVFPLSQNQLDALKEHSIQYCGKDKTLSKCEPPLSIALKSKQKLQNVDSNSKHSENFQKQDHRNHHHTARSLHQTVEEQPTVEANFDKERNLELETKQLQVKFSTLVSKIIASLNKNKVTVQQLNTYLFYIKALKAVLTTVDQQCLLFSPTYLESIEASCEKPAHVFEKLKGYYSWFDFGLIEGIIDAFSEESTDLLLSLAQYKHSLKKYCQNRLCPLKIGLDDKILRSEQITKLVFKVDREWAQIRFSDIEQITATICDILSLRREVLCLRSIRSGCIELTYSIPKHVVEVVFPLSSYKEAEFAEHGIRFSGNNDDSEDSNAMLMPKDTEHLYPNDSVTLEVGSGHTARISQQDKADLDTDSGIDSHCESMSGIQTNSYLSTVF